MKSRTLGYLGIFLALTFTTSAALAASTLRRMELSAPAADSARLVLDLSSLPARKVFTVDKAAGKPDRVVIDLSATQLASGLRLPQAAGPVRAVRSGIQPGNTLRLVLELSSKYEPSVNVSGSQLIVNIGAVPKQSAAATPAPAAAPAAPAVPAAVRAVHAPDDTGRDIIVAVDAGHGGDDPGAIGANGTKEKDITLAIARELAKRIDAEPGMRAYLTRKDDRFVELADRRNQARSARADIFVSVHADSIENRSVAGSSVYVLSEKGASSVAAGLLAARENAVDLKGGISLRGMDEQTASLLMNVSQGATKEASLEVAVTVLSHLDRVGTVRKTKVQQANFVVLRLPDTPSMLVETAYISNPGEEQKLRDPAHQAAVAEAIFNGVRQHFRSNPPSGTLFARERARPGITPVMAGSPGP